VRQVSWFKTDDKLPNHRKARAVRKSHPDKSRDVAPFGIWVMAGALSDDGWVPLEVIEDWDDNAEELADRLVAAGFWHPTTRDGEPGYVFHDWPDHNPVKDDSDPSKAGTFGNHVRWHVQRQEVRPDCDHCPKEPAAIAPMIAPNRPDIAPDSENDRPESLPSRPVPTRTRPEPDPTPSRKRSETPERFDEFWDTYGNKVGRKKAETAYRSALKKPGVTADLLVAAAAAYITWQTAEGKHPKYTKHPATWLNGEHWRDERPTTQAPQTRVQQHLALAEKLHAEERDNTIPFPQIGQGR
jgi:hypothetical protein